MHVDYEECIIMLKKLYNLLFILTIAVPAFTLSGCMGGNNSSADSISSVDLDPGNDQGLDASLEMTVPLDQSVGVSRSINIVIGSTVALDQSTLTSSNVQLLGPNGQSIPTDVSYDNSTVTISPVSILEEASGYSVVITADVMDMSGNTLAAEYSWSFTTASGSLPPEFSKWESDMVAWGGYWGEFQDPNGPNGWNTRFVNAYYDILWNLYQIKEYTGQSEPWDTYIEYAKSSYRDEFYRPDNYNSNGYYRFPHGLLKDYMSGGDTTLQDIRMIRDNMAFSLVVEFDENGAYPGQSQRMSREMSYALQANVCAEKAGEPRLSDRISHFIPWMENHMYEWKSANFSDDAFFQPFMFALTAHALIEFYEWEIENGRDPHVYWPTTHWNTIPEALADFATWMFNESVVREGPYQGERMWVANYGGQGNGAFRYADREYEEGAGVIYPGLNLLISPVYAWLYNHTGDTNYREIGDVIFGSGLRQDSGVDWSGKAFDQNYRWSIKFVDWRREGDQKWLP